MSYTINLTNATGNVTPITIADGTINTSSTSLTLVGKNYAGYGQFLDQNSVNLLQSSAGITQPGTPLAGQLWWDISNGVLKVWQGTAFKNVAAATSSGSAPSGSVSVAGDLWYDSTNAQLNVYNGSSWILVGPQSSQGQGTSGAIVATLSDGSTTHVVVELWVNNSIVGIISKDAAFTPSPGISGFTTIRPGITLATTISGIPQLFQGTATNAQTLNSLSSSAFMLTGSNTSTTGTLSVVNNTGLFVGANSNFRVNVNGGSGVVTLSNQTSGANLNFGVNISGTPTTALSINGTTGIVSSSTGINAQYADLAERFEADAEMAPGTVVELGGSAEITQVTSDLSENVFGVISTRAAYMMNSQAGTNATHPPVAMTGRVPVRTIGTVRKGDRLVSAGNGLARAAQAGEATAFNVIGRALKDKVDSGEGTVEAIVTIK
jgi:hypothetical protein